MSEQQINLENNIQSFEQPGTTGGGWKKPVLIGSVLAVLLAIIGLLVWTFWLKGIFQPSGVRQSAGEPVVPVVNTNVNQPAPSVTTNAPAQVSPTAPANTQVIPAGIDRPITKEERLKYGFSATDDIWVKTTSPTDGSTPQMSFYNKTVNLAPIPYVNPPPGKK